MENHCCAVRWKFIYSGWMAKSEAHYSKTSIPSPPTLFWYCIYKLQMADNTRWKIIYYCQCNMNCCSISHTKDHQHHIKSLPAQHNTMQEKKRIPRVWIKAVKNASKMTTKYTGVFSTWSHKWRVQNKKTETCEEFIQWARISVFCRNSVLVFFFFSWHCTTCLPLLLFKISRIFASLMLSSVNPVSSLFMHGDLIMTLIFLLNVSLESKGTWILIPENLLQFISKTEISRLGTYVRNIGNKSQSERKTFGLVNNKHLSGRNSSNVNHLFVWF